MLLTLCLGDTLTFGESFRMRLHYLLAFVPAFLLSCTTDRDLADTTVIPDPEAVVVHYWNFNSLPSGTLTAVQPDASLVTGAAITYDGEGAGYMDAFDPGYDTNAQNGDVAGQGLRARNPSDTRTLRFALPTTGFRNIVLRFATARTGSGATQQSYAYTLDGVNYTSDGLVLAGFTTKEDPTNDLVVLDFSGIAGANDNPNFRFAITFSGDTAAGTSGNNRFDNVTVEGVPLVPITAPSNLVYPTPQTWPVGSAITPIQPTVTGSGIHYNINPALPDGLTLDATTGSISGTPTIETPAASYTVTATNAGGSTTAAIQITIAAASPLFLVHYWNFNALPTGILTAVAPDSSLLAGGAASITYPGTGAGYLDQVNPGSDLNAQENATAGLALRIRNPSDTRALLIKASTSGYKDIVVSFATTRTSSGASEQVYSYTIDGVNFITTSLPVTTFSPGIDPSYSVVTLDFGAITGADNNPNFALRIGFGGTTASGTSGNNRIDNVAISGRSL